MSRAVLSGMFLLVRNVRTPPRVAVGLAWLSVHVSGSSARVCPGEFPCKAALKQGNSSGTTALVCVASLDQWSRTEQNSNPFTFHPTILPKLMQCITETTKQRRNTVHRCGGSHTLHCARLPAPFF